MATVASYPTPPQPTTTTYPQPTTKNVNRFRVAAMPPQQQQQQPAPPSPRTKPTHKDAKQRPTNTPVPLVFSAKGCKKPHPQKNGDGEDAFFISGCGRGLGVADGVGAWIDVGVDSGEYSRELMDRCNELIQDTGTTCPMDILQNAYNHTKAVGSSTACVATMDQNVFRAANLGDSGFMIFRYEACTVNNDENTDSANPTDRRLEGMRDIKQQVHKEWSWICVNQSTEQQHYFNCPLQLGTNSEDLPSHADEYEFVCQEDDLIVLGTDGLFDNVAPEEVAALLNHFKLYDMLTDARRKGNLDEAMTALATNLLRISFRMASQKEKPTPFAKSAFKHGYEYHGGKLDDITIVAAMAVRESFPDSPAAAHSGDDSMDLTEHTGSPRSVHTSMSAATEPTSSEAYSNGFISDTTSLQDGATQDEIMNDSESE